MTKKPLLIPFDEKGNLLSYGDTWRIKEQRENYTFNATLTLTSWSRGQSAANFILTDHEGHEYSCFMHSFFAIVKDARFVAGQITAEFTFEKCGQNYGLKLCTS